MPKGSPELTAVRKDCFINSEKNLEENAKSGNWLEGARFGADVTSEELESWISGLQ